MVRMRASWSSWIWATARSLLLGRLACVGVGGTGTEAAFAVGDIWPPMLPGRGGKGIAGGGEGKEATEADLRRCELIELERFGPGSCWTSSNLA